MDQVYQELLQNLPDYLRPFVVDQNYDRYTSRDQAVWRYIMRRNLHYFKSHAHKAYIKGLKTTGIRTDRIPNIVEMNRALAKIGWGAVTVDGFLPPAVFMEFQYHKVLVISAEMRSIQHILYTPAPDIVHEAAGHAPIIANQVYATFLQRFGEIGMKAFSSKLDHEIYEAIRQLSIIKEYPATTQDEIAHAEQEIEGKTAQNSDPSEMALLSRLHWWTVEYGLIGTPDNFKIYGAGLLSSVGESKHCLSNDVKKIALTIEAIRYNYDITKEQPQLFVTSSGDQLMAVLEEYANTMAFRIGGKTGLDRAIASGTIATCEYSSGLQVSGGVSAYQTGVDGNPVYLQMKGPSSLAWQDCQLGGHGSDYHQDGFGSPVGKLKGQSTPLECFHDQKLRSAGLLVGQQVNLEFASGIKVQGTLRRMLRKNDRLLLCSFSDCSVTASDGNMLFEPAWGMYDMAVGENISSVFAGPADKTNYKRPAEKSTQNAISIRHSDKEDKLFRLYDLVDKCLHSAAINQQSLKDVSESVKRNFEDEWLLLLNLLEGFRKISDTDTDTEQTELEKRLNALKLHSTEYDELITSGLKMLKINNQTHLAD